MQLPYSDKLEIKYLNRLFDNTSECYKFFWFQAILTKVLAGQEEISYGELVDEMIADAWYMVTEYHLRLGPKDTLERLVHYISDISHLKSSEKKAVILDYLKECQDKEVMRRKRVLIHNVPYRLQAPFLNTLKGKEWNVSERELIDRINQQERIMYLFAEFDGMKTKILIQPEWIAYFQENQEIIKGWLRYHMSLYLQRRNPNVPGIINKLQAPSARGQLEKVQKYWKLLLTMGPVREIYGMELLKAQDMSIDHFVPWSYVTHDEFWNLHPTTSGINSSKSNYLPDWGIYFPRLCQLEYFSYQMMEKEIVSHAFEECAREHLNSDEIRGRMYRRGQSAEEFSRALEEVVQPVYQSAKNCGFCSWIYSGEKK